MLAVVLVFGASGCFGSSWKFDSGGDILALIQLTVSFKSVWRLCFIVLLKHFCGYNQTITEGLNEMYQLSRDFCISLM